MPKNHIPELLKILFETKIAVQIAQINYGNHVGYDAMVTLLHDAQVRFLQSHGHTEIDIDGVALMVQQLEVIYKKEVFYGETLSFALGIEEVNKARVALLCSVRNQKGEEVCRSRTKAIFVNLAERKLVAPPKFFSEL